MKYPFLLVFCIFLAVGSLRGQLPDGFIREQVVTGLNPTKMALAPDGRIFIAEKHGVIRIVRDDILLPDPFLSLKVDDSNERGLAGIALDPAFEQNHLVYVYYTVPGLFRNRVSRFTANGDRAIPGSEEVIFELDELRADVHNGGDLLFGLDGKLYITTGDGGYSWVSENPWSLLGKVLRINADGSIPEDNPFYTEYQGKLRAIYASGFRNPFSGVIHPVTGTLYVNDVGNATWEEINHVMPGKFYGWSSVEGYRNGQAVSDNYADPLYAYDHQNGCAAVGAAIYEPETYQFPGTYWGKYFFGDYCTGEIRLFDLERETYDGVFMTGADRLICLVTHPDGTMYYLERRGRGDGSPWDNTSTTDGVLGKISFTGSGAPFISIQPKSEFAVAGEPVEFFIEALGAPPLMYQWYDDGEPVPGETGPVYRIGSVSIGQDQSRITARVWNAQDTVESVSALLTVTNNQRPVLAITSPPEGAVYRAGDTIVFSGTAIDPEDGQVPAGRIGWRIDFHHDEHTHPAAELEYGADHGVFEVPRIGEIDTNVFYRFYLIAEDGDGLRNVAYRDVHPGIVRTSVRTLPGGLDINSDGKLVTAPFDIYSVNGVTRTVAAPGKQVRGDSIYFFDFWSDGFTGPARTFDAGDPDLKQPLQAEYSGIRSGRGSGWNVSYFDNMDLAGPPVLTFRDSAIDHQYFFDSPHPSMPEDFFSMRWEGYLLPYKSDLYQLSLEADDGVRMWIGDELVIDEWAPGLNSGKGTVYLEENRFYPVKLEYFEHSWGAYVTLKWLASHFSEEVVPVSQMYPKDAFDETQDRPLGLHPNPAREMVFLSAYLGERNDFMIECTDALGRRVLQQTVQFDLGENRVGLDVSGLAQGNYLVRCLDRNGNAIFESWLAVR